MCALFHALNPIFFCVRCYRQDHDISKDRANTEESPERLAEKIDWLMVQLRALKICTRVSVFQTEDFLLLNDQSKCTQYVIYPERLDTCGFLYFSKYSECHLVFEENTLQLRKLWSAWVLCV